MAYRTLATLLASFVIPVLGKTPMPVKAGDPAPMLSWTKIIASAASLAGPQNLSGETTVVLFLTPVSHNDETLASWNKLVEQFAGKPVNFVWIANEAEESLTPFLKNHPVLGWMLLDPQEESYKAYGIEGGSGVLIDSRGVIAGFTSGAPDHSQIQAVLDGRAIAIRGDATDAQLDAIFEGRAVRLEAEPFRMPAVSLEEPDLPRSNEVQISSSNVEGTISSTTPDHWIRRGFELKAILSEVLDTSITVLKTDIMI